MQICLLFIVIALYWFQGIIMKLLCKWTIHTVFGFIHKCFIGYWDHNHLKCSHKIHYFHTPDLILIAAAEPWEKCHWPICLVKSPPEMNMWGLTMGTKSVWWFHSISGALTICLDNPEKEEIWHKCSHKSIWYKA